MRIWGALAAICGAIGVAVAWSASPDRSVSQADTVGAAEVDAPREHFALANPAELDKEDATIAYNSLIDLMMRGYVASAEPTTQRYRTWQRFNDAPYRSATHGNRYVNNYANHAAAAAGYGRLGVVMPEGAIVAKDSFTATKDGRLFPGALFFMEKLPAQASPATADWRYVMIMPDGSTFGDSRINPARMAFCHACHAARADDDYLFFVPPGVEAQPAANPR
jgi:hypothetical protein